MLYTKYVLLFLWLRITVFIKILALYNMIVLNAYHCGYILKLENDHSNDNNIKYLNPGSKIIKYK